MAYNMPTLLDNDSHTLSRCDRCIVNTFELYLRQISGGELKFTQVQPVLLQIRQALEQGGIICLAVDGTVKFMTHRADNLIHKYFPDAPTRNLPEILHNKFKLQLQNVSFHDPELFSTLLLRVEQENYELRIHLVEDPTRQQHLLLLEENMITAFSINALELLGLTRREAEVLFWVTKDKSNASIARTLGCCEGTVRKHLENIYKKLEVQTRIGAVMGALQRLGLLREVPVTALE